MSVAIDDLANRVYVAIHHEQYVSVIDGETDSLVANIALIPQGDPTDVAVNPNNHYVYVAYSQGNAVTEIDTGPSGLGPYEQTNLVVGDGPRFVQVDPGIDRAYVSVINFYQLGIVTAGIVEEDPLQLDIIPAFTGVNTKTHCAYTSGDDRVTLRKVLKICDADLNQPPECSGAEPSVDLLWPANHNFVPVDILGVIDPDGDALTITIDSIFQDEAVDAKGSGNTAPDGGGIGTSTADVRAERVGRGNGRVYHIDFTADDGNSGACVGEVTVGVPHDQGQGAVPVDDGALYDSTIDP
jgi:hypothetical protein